MRRLSLAAPQTRHCEFGTGGSMSAGEMTRAAYKKASRPLLISGLLTPTMRCWNSVLVFVRNWNALGKAERGPPRTMM